MVGQQRQQVGGRETDVALVVRIAARQGLAAAEPLHAGRAESLALVSLRGKSDTQTAQRHDVRAGPGGTAVLALVEQHLGLHRSGQSRGGVLSTEHGLDHLGHDALAVASTPEQHQEDVLAGQTGDAIPEDALEEGGHLRVITHDLGDEVLPVRARGIDALPLHRAAFHQPVIGTARAHLPRAQVHNAIRHGQRPRVSVNLITGDGQRALQIGLGKFETALAPGLGSQAGSPGLHLLGLGLETSSRLLVAVAFGILSQPVKVSPGGVVGLSHMLHIRPGPVSLLDEIHRPVVSGPPDPLVSLANIGMAALEKVGEQETVAQLVGIEAAFHKVRLRYGEAMLVQLGAVVGGLALLFFGDAFLNLLQHFLIGHWITSVALLSVKGRAWRRGAADATAPENLPGFPRKISKKIPRFLGVDSPA